MGEFQLIEWIRQHAGGDHSGVELGIGDDAAILSLPAECELAVTADTLNAGVHFDADTPPENVGHKALAVNLSDLAAMGAVPRWVLLSLSMPGQDRAWFEGFINGFLGLAKEFGVALVGGDTCSGELSISVTALGQVQAGQALTRSGASPGDLIAVSGQLGNAALALKRMLDGADPGAAGLLALQKPLPRIALGASLVGKATACIDISDGLLADLGHITESSACGAEVDLSRLPGSHDLQQCDAHLRWNLQLAGGDDYELCFSIPPRLLRQLSHWSTELNLELTIIGKMVGGTGVRCIGAEGAEYIPEQAGYEHFQ